MPPCLLIHGTADKSVPYEQSVNFKARLEELGVPCELITIPDGVHDRRQWEPIAGDYQERMADWLVRVLRPRD
jgi:alpha-L-fucosidase 2